MRLAPREPMRQCHPLWPATESFITLANDSIETTSRTPWRTRRHQAIQMACA
jgi:hypothetical protein